MVLNRKLVLLCSFVLAIATSGCRSSAAITPEAKVNEGSLSAQALADVADNSAQAPLIQVTDAGIGGLTASTPFDVDTIQAIFPALSVSTTTASAEGMDYTIIVVSDGSTELLQIEATGNKLYRVTALSSQSSGPTGHTPGEAISEIYKGNIPECSRMIDGPGNLVSCSAPGSQSVSYLFAGPWSPAVYAPLPDADLSNGVLQEIVWIPRN